MSYQLIYTSAAHLLDSGGSGYGVVACSGSLPRALSRKLIELSEYKEPAEQGITGPQYSYRVLDCSGTLFHILSCVQNAGADYSQRSCHIAHHLALTYDEVQALRRNAARPTPAGIILALRKASFWCSRWEGEPQVIEAEPRLTASALPDATTQATWKVMTGHKSNARVFFTPPYDKESLAIFPKGTRAEDILLLLNESDWLSATRGWGRTFTTYGTAGDTYAETQRICAAVGSVLEQRAAFTRKPVVTISLSMTLPDQQDFAPESEPLGSGVAKAILQPPALAAGAEGASHIPYKYIESPDEESFDTPPPRSPMLRWGFYLAALAVLAGGVYALTSTKVDDAGKVAGKIIINQLHPSEARVLLDDMLHEPYSAERVSRQLDKLEARLSSAVTSGALEPREQLMLDCVSILRHASLDNHGHAANLRRLAENAPLLQEDADELCQLYMHEATHDRPVEEWLLAVTPMERAGWGELVRDFPGMADWLMQPPFFPFMNPLLVQPAANDGMDSPAGGDGQGEVEEDIKDTSADGFAAPQTLEPLSSLLLMPGDDLPEAVLAFLRGTPTDVAPGNYSLSIFGQSGPPDTPVSSPSCGTDSTLHIEPEAARPATRFQLELRNTGGQPFPRVEISLGKGGSLAHVASSDGRPAAVGLTVLQGGRPFSYLLVGQLEVPVIPLGESMPPAAAQVDLTLVPEDMELHTPTPGFPHDLLILKERRNFPWAPLRNGLQLRKPILVQLPVLAGANKIGHCQQEGASLPYEWDALPASGSGTSSDPWEIQIWRVNDFSHALSQAFYQAANESCCGRNPQGDPALTLANLYALTVGLDKPGLPKKARSELFAAYCRLFADKQFSGILNQLLEEFPQLCLTPEQAAGSSGSCHRARHYVEKELSLPANRALIRQKIAEALSHAVAKAYTEERTRQAGETQERMSLLLQRVSRTSHGEWLWQFSLKPSSSTTPSPNPARK